MKLNRSYILAVLVVAVVICGIYVYYKDSYFDRMVGSRSVYRLSYHIGFSIYRELLYDNKSGDEGLFKKIVYRYESDPDTRKWNFKKTIHVDRAEMNLVDIKSLPFHEYSEKDIKEQVSFATEDLRDGTDISNGGRFIVIRVYSQR